MLLLPLDQRMRAVGTITGEVAFGILREAAREGVAGRRNTVDRGIGKARERHRARIDILSNVAPFTRDRVR